MKKRLVLLISALILALATTFAFVACGGGSDDKGRRTEADGVYYLYENGLLDKDVSITVSRGKITAATGDNMAGLDDFLGTSGSKTEYSGSVSGSSVTWTITVTIPDPTSKMSVKAAYTSTGDYSNGVMHFTSMSAEVKLGSQTIESMPSTECDTWYCKEGKTPEDINGSGGGGGTVTPGPGVDPVDPSGPTNTSWDTAIRLTLGMEYNVSIPYSSEVYYSFTPVESGLYVVESKECNGDLNVSLYDSRYSYITSCGYNDSGNFRLQYMLEAGATYYYCIGGGGNDSNTCKFSLTQVELPTNTGFETSSPITVGTQYSVDLSYVEELYYSFVPTESNTYVIESTEHTGDPYVYLYDSQQQQITSNDDGGEGYNFRLVYSLEAGRTYYLRMGNERSIYKFSVTTLPNSTRADAFVITNITNGIDVNFMAQNQKVWYSFTPTTSGTYKFVANSSYNSVAIYRGDETTAMAVHQPSSNDYVSLNLSCALEAGTTYYICFQNKNNGSSNYAVDVTLCDGTSRATALVASLGVSNNVNIATGGAEVWFVFRPTERNRYIIQSSESTGDPFCELYTGSNSSATASDDNGAGGNDFRLVRVLEADTNYYIRARMPLSLDTGRYILTVTAADGTTVETAIIAQPDTDYTVRAASATPIWLEFTATVSGEYTVCSTGNAGDPSCEIYSNVNSRPIAGDDNSGSSGNNFCSGCSLTSGNTYYVKVMQQSVTAVACTVRIITPVGSTRANPIVATLDTEYPVNTSNNTWFAYTPTVTAEYIVRSVGSGNDPDCALYENDDPNAIASDTHSGQFVIRRELTAGVTYYARVYNASSFIFVWDRADGTERELAVRATVNTPYEVRVTGSDQEVWYMFTPSSSGDYSFSSVAVGSCDPSIDLYYGTNSSPMASADDDNGRNFHLVSNLERSTTYYIRLKAVNGALGSFTFTIRKMDGTARDKAYVTYADSRYEVRVSSANQSVWYSITPLASGRYTFESQNGSDYDPSVTLYQGNGTTGIATNDNISDSDKNFRLQYDLVAGTTYYLEVKNGANSYSGSFYLKVIGIPGSTYENAIEATLGTLHDVNIVYANQEIWFEFTPETTGNYVIASSNNSANTDPVLSMRSSDLSSDGQNISSTDLNFRYTFTLIANETYYFRAALSLYSSYEQTGSYKFSITVAPGSARDNPVIVENNVVYAVLTGTMDTVVWYSFTPTVTQEYTIYTSNIYNSCDPYIRIYQGDSTTALVSNKDVSDSDKNFRHVMEMTAGETYYITAALTPGSSNTGSYNIVVRVGNRTGESREMAILAALNTNYQVDITTQNTAVWFEFTPTVSGSYTMESTNRGTCDPHGYLYSGSSTSALTDNDDGGSDSRNFRITYNMTAGVTYYIQAKLHGTGGGSGSFTFTITKN